MYRKFKIEDSLARNMFLRSIMDFCMADVTSDGVNEYVQKGQVSSTLRHEICSVVQKGASVWLI